MEGFALFLAGGIVGGIVVFAYYIKLWRELIELQDAVLFLRVRLGAQHARHGGLISDEDIARRLACVESDSRCQCVPPHPMS